MPKLKFGKKAIFGMTWEEFIPVLIAVVIIFAIGYVGSRLFAAVVPNQQDQATLNNFLLLTGKTDELLKNQRLTGFVEFPYSISQGNVLVAFDYDSDRILYLKNLVKSGGQYDIGNAFRPADCGNKACICVYKLPLISPGKLSMPVEKERGKGILKCRQFGGKIKFASVPSPQIDQMLTTYFEGITLNGYKKLELKAEIRAPETLPTEEKTLPVWDKGYASLLWAAYTNSAFSIHIDKYEENSITYIFISPVKELLISDNRNSVLRALLDKKAYDAFSNDDWNSTIFYYNALLEEPAFHFDKKEIASINARLGKAFLEKEEYAQSVSSYENWLGAINFSNITSENIDSVPFYLADICAASFLANLSYEQRCEFAVSFSSGLYEKLTAIGDKETVKFALKQLCGASAQIIELSVEGCKKEEVIAIVTSA